MTTLTTSTTDLLPESFRRSIFVRQTLMHWGFVSVLVVTLVGVAAVWKYREAHDVMTLARQQTETLQPLRQLRLQHTKHRMEFVKNRELIETYSNLLRDNEPFNLLMLLAACHRKVGHRVALHRFGYTLREKTPETPTPGQPAKKDATIPDLRILDLRAQADDDAALDAFLVELRATNLFTKLLLKSTTTAVVNSKPTKVFDLEGSY